MRTIAVVTAGLSQPSSTRLLADRLAEAVVSDLGPDTRIEVVELRDLAHDITNNLLTRFPSPTLAAAIETVVNADALIAVTPIFNASYSGLFKSFFDVIEMESLAQKPVLIAATGGSERHSLALEHALRPLFSYLRAIVVPTAVYAASSDWGSADVLSGRIERAAGELAALVSRTAPSGPVDPFANAPSFAELLGD
jgi:FMN reductase